MIIQNEAEYKQAFVEFDQLIQILKDSPELQSKAQALSEAIQAYEATHVAFPKPTTLSSMIELKMYEMKLKQKDLAQLLGIESSRVSEILHGKRRVTLEIAKRLHEKLGIDGNFILERA
ncbi:helix-turn-helix domain-containing protein [Arsenicibacter rosenii]|uniref:HTH cro/C1-type domain-containing protein n=1 Tax=Arsenicibacter rosenii TaxID=1750698 RepID=A0A1S2VBZ0_9BACT|nr:helix-turn-helix domain-containing protein [Arsenicibacter rosenii]OIN56234.1 hypothetical protein BLX24_25900 [Arsenicibacter rosenii]